MATLLQRLGLAAVRHRAAVTITWLPALIALFATTAAWSGETTSELKIPGRSRPPRWIS
jgi:putative drug exporter of the RND superfamily